MVTRYTTFIGNLMGPQGRPGTFDAATAVSVPAGQAAEAKVWGPNGQYVEFKIPRGLPGVNAVPADEFIATVLAAVDTDAHAAMKAAVEAEGFTFAEQQLFDATNGFGVGDVRVSFVDGFFGQRMHVTGSAPGIMPYIEVVPTSPFSTDVGQRLAGYQLYRTVGGGGVDDREFLAIESVSDAGTVPGFVIATWASGEGQARPLVFRSMAKEVMRLREDGHLGMGGNARIFWDNPTADHPLILQRREGPFRALESRTYGSAEGTFPRIVLTRNRGTIDAAEYPRTDDILGAFTSGAMSGSTAQEGAGIRFEAASDWGTGNRHSKIVMRAAPSGNTSMGTMAEFQDAGTSLETALLVRVNRGGTKTVDRVYIGAADSAGTGYRALRVVN